MESVVNASAASTQEGVLFFFGGGGGGEGGGGEGGGGGSVWGFYGRVEVLFGRGAKCLHLARGGD